MVHIIGQKITTYCTLRLKTLEMDFRDGRFNMIVMMLTVLLWILLCLKELGVTISDCCYIVSWKYFNKYKTHKSTENMLIWKKIYRYLVKKIFNFLNILFTFSISANLVLQHTIERIHVGKKYGDIPRGIFVIRGDNVVLLGEIVSVLMYTHIADKNIKFKVQI